MYNVDIKGNIDEKTTQLVKDAIAQEDANIMLTIDSCGGSLEEGLRMYDAIRSAKGKNFFATVVGNCMSSATLVLCGVPMDNRSAYPHATFLIHHPLIEQYGMSNLNEVKQLANTMQSASDQIQNIYRERTKLDDQQMLALMNAQDEFYADKAVTLGLVARITELYNNRKKLFKKSMKKNTLKALVNKIANALLNEAYTTKDGQSISIVALEIGGTAECADGVYELQDGTVITVEGGVIVDLIAPEAPTEETPAEEVVNEGEEEKKEDAPAEEAPAEEEQAVEEAKEEIAQVAEEVQSAEDAQEVADLTAEIEQIVKDKIEEVVNKYKPMVDLVEKCGGMKKLKALADVKHIAKEFQAQNTKPATPRSLEELLNLKRNRK